MSYYVTLDVTLKAESKPLLEKALEFWRADFGIDNEGEIIEKDGVFEVSLGVCCSWVGYHEDIQNFSEIFPTLTIYAEGSGEEPGDLFRLVAKDGKVAEKQAIIIYPEFEELEGKLKEEMEQLFMEEACL